MCAENTGQNIKKTNDERISFIFGIIFIICLLGFYGIVYAIDQYAVFPKPLDVADELENPDAFIAERARDHLKYLHNLGPKITGSSVTYTAAKYLRDQINIIKKEAHPNQRIDVDVQIVSGSYYLDYKPFGAINSYANIQNVVAKIYGANSTDSVLVNSHYDTVPTSPGGSDDGIMVAVALEVIRKMSQASERPRNNLIFLFNDGEEESLLGSHGFITQHEWAPEARVVVNLEATGGGGRETLFQTGPDQAWLMKYYNVPHPHGHAAGEELFQSNIIPSDTDFRIFRDFGGMIGYDMAFTRDGYRYHTKYDGFDNIDYGSYQHTGVNILQLVRNLANAEEVSHPKTDEQGKVIYFDFIGQFWINYSHEVAIILNTITIILSCAVTVWSIIDFKMGWTIQTLVYLVIIFVMILVGWILATCAVLIVAVILDISNNSMSWYSLPYLSIGLYCAPVLICLCINTYVSHSFVNHEKLSLTQKVIIDSHMIRLVWCIVILIGTSIGIRSVYTVMIPVLFNTMAMYTYVIIIQSLKIRKQGLQEETRAKLEYKIWAFIHIIFNVLPTMFIMYMAHEIIALFVPICGRFGASTNPELIIGLFSVLLTILITCFYVPLFAYIHKPAYVLLGILAIFIIAFIFSFTPLGFPYKYSQDSPKPQRFSIYHTERIFRDKDDNIIKHDTGFYFPNMDRNSPRSIKDYVGTLSNEANLADDCKIAPVCGLPVTNSRSLKSLEESNWIPVKEKPIFNTQITYNYTKNSITPTKTEYSFCISGTDRIDVYLSPKNKVRLDSVSLLENLLENNLLWNEQPLYYFHFVYGKMAASFTFNFIIETPENFSGETVDFAISAKYYHDDKNINTKEFHYFLEDFPNWTVITHKALAYYESFILS